MAVAWKLAVLSDNWLINRYSDTVASRCMFPSDNWLISRDRVTEDPYICGDTPLSSGYHAWRVQYRNLGDNGQLLAIGVVDAKKPRIEDPAS